jgi:hypothetical protein
MDSVPLREYIEKIMDERQQAITIATCALEKRLELLNELRGDVMTRSEYTSAHEALSDKISALTALTNKLTIALLIMLITALVAALFSLVKH